ncbi:hypothetical protein O3P69_012660 [Scylla paramamosain]|uniref:Uncharacterized protein n=1 Tax=Scylla paramamosain TaxID=85552 RepID=A0AAW0SJK4_SCYPA
MAWRDQLRDEVCDFDLVVIPFGHECELMAESHPTMKLVFYPEELRAHLVVAFDQLRQDPELEEVPVVGLCGLCGQRF